MGQSPCEVRYRVNAGPKEGLVLTDNQIWWGHAWLGGRVALVILEGNEWQFEEKLLDTIPMHSFPNTGMIRSWCQCGCEGTFDWISGEYKATTRKESAA